MRCLFCHYLFLISRSFGVSEWLCFVIVPFLGYLKLYCTDRFPAQRSLSKRFLFCKEEFAPYESQLFFVFFFVFVFFFFVFVFFGVCVCVCGRGGGYRKGIKLFLKTYSP